MGRRSKKKAIPKREYFPVTLYVLKSNRAAYNLCFNKIGKLLDQSKPIPIKLFNEWVGYFYAIQDKESIEKQAKLKEVLGKTINHFSGDRYYQFSGTGEDNLPFNFADFIKRVLVAYYMSDWHRRESDRDTVEYKDNVIRFFYSAIRDHASEFENLQPPLGQLGHYRTTVIAGYMTMQLGYTITSIQSPSNGQINNAAKHAVGKMKAATK